MEAAARVQRALVLCFGHQGSVLMVPAAAMPTGAAGGRGVGAAPQAARGGKFLQQRPRGGRGRWDGVRLGWGSGSDGQSLQH